MIPDNHEEQEQFVSSRLREVRIRTAVVFQIQYLKSI